MQPSQQPILYVEDEENDVFLLKLAFDSAQIAAPLRVVTDGKEAIDYLSGKGRYTDPEQHPRPCMVLLDLRLPIVDGFEVLRWVRQQPALAGIPVVIFSSSDADQDKQRAVELGASGYLVKPANMTRMREAVRLLSERYVSSCAGSIVNSAARKGMQWDDLQW